MDPAAAFLMALGIWMIFTEGVLPNLVTSKPCETSSGLPAADIEVPLETFNSVGQPTLRY